MINSTINNFKKYIRSLLNKDINNSSLSNNNVVEIKTERKCKGIALISYGNEYLELRDDDPKFEGHSSKWESKKIVEIFLNKGFDVDAISPYDTEFVPSKQYDIIFDIHYNLCRFEKFISNNTITILHSTGSYPEYAANQEINRVNELMYRKRAQYTPKRICDPIYFTRSLKIARFCSLFGTKHTLSTFPNEFQKKIRLLPVTYSNSILKDLNEPLGKEFLWFYGYGAVHKGLDILLDIFSEKKEYTLNIVGNIDTEKDFINIYAKELYSLPNIKYHGFLSPMSNEYKNVIDKCFCFIAPSCSESTSTAVITCLNTGLYPIYSRDNGVQLSSNGYLLENCRHKEIENAIKSVMNKNKNELRNAMLNNRTYVQREHSRERFSIEMDKFIDKALLNEYSK